MDVGGLITMSRAAAAMDERHRPFAKDMPPSTDLLSVVRQVRPQAIIGASTVWPEFYSCFI
jgi:hypothetical protein